MNKHTQNTPNSNRMSSSSSEQMFSRLKTFGNNLIGKNNELRHHRYLNKKRHMRKAENDRSLPTNNNINRVTVKRGVFPNMIRSKCIKRQLFNRNHDSLASSGSSDGIEPFSELPNFSRIGEARQPRMRTNYDSSTSERSSSTAKKRPKVDLVLSDSPYLLQMNHRSELTERTGDEPLEEPSPLAFKTPENTGTEKTDNFPATLWALSAVGNYDRLKIDRLGPLQKSPKIDEDIDRQNCDEMVRMVSQVESCNPKEAELIYWYHQYTESIKRVVIVEREKNFEKFPDALETIKSKLRALNLRRCEETSGHSDQKVDMFGPENYDNDDECVPMNVDENIETLSSFRTPSPLPRVQTKNEVRRPIPRAETESSSTSYSNPSSAKALLNNDRENDRNRPQNNFPPPVMIRKVVGAESSLMKIDWITTSAHQKNLSDFSLSGPSFSVQDTIDQNAGLAGVEYLKNVTQNKPKKGGRQKENVYDKDWWRVADAPRPGDELRGIRKTSNITTTDVRFDRLDDDLNIVDDDLSPWKTSRPKPPKASTTSNVQFDLPRKTAPQKDSRRDFHSSKKPVNARGVENRYENFNFDIQTSRFKEKMKHSYVVDEDEAEENSPLFF